MNNDKTLYCNQCGKKIPEKHEYCSHCGNPIKQPKSINDNKMPENIGVKEKIKDSGNKKLAIIIGAIVVVIILAFAFFSMASTPSGEIIITGEFGQLQENNKYMVYYTLKNVNLEDLENGKYKVNVEYYAGNNLISTVTSDDWMESGDYELMSDTKYISTEKIDKAVIKLTDETGTLIQSKEVQFEDTTDQSNADSSNSADSSSSSSGYQVRITYDGEWSGAVGAVGSTSSYDGSGSDTIDVGEVSYDIVSAVIQKRDSGSGELKVEILKDGVVVKGGSATSTYGVVSITSS